MEPAAHTHMFNNSMEQPLCRMTEHVARTRRRAPDPGREMLQALCKRCKHYSNTSPEAECNIDECSHEMHTVMTCTSATAGLSCHWSSPSTNYTCRGSTHICPQPLPTHTHPHPGSHIKPPAAPAPPTHCTAAAQSCHPASSPATPCPAPPTAKTARGCHLPPAAVTARPPDACC
jgi:hypothetical protein